MAKLGRFSALHQPAQKVTKRRVVVVVAPPPAPPAPESGNAGTITVGFNTYNFGMGPQTQRGYDSSLGFGSTTGPGGGPAALTWAAAYTEFGSTTTRIRFVPGTYSGYTVDSNRLVNGSSADISVTIGGLTATLTVEGNGPSDNFYTVSSDPFSLSTKVGQTLNVVLNGNV